MRSEDKVVGTDDGDEPKVDGEDKRGCCEGSAGEQSEDRRRGRRSRRAYLAMGGAAQNASAIEGDDIATTVLMKTVDETAPA